MHEVRVYDSSGTLKKVISEKVLQARSDHQIQFPAGYRKIGKKAKPRPISAKTSKPAKTA